MKTPETFYKYRAFDTRTLLSLCEDTLYFSNPGDFNDPLDCSPTIYCDSTKDDLRKLLAFFTSRRVTIEILEHVKKAKIKVNEASNHARNIATKQTLNELANIAYMATDPEYGGQTIEAESHMLVEAIERELAHYWLKQYIANH